MKGSMPAWNLPYYVSHEASVLPIVMTVTAYFPAKINIKIEDFYQLRRAIA
jgi:hypothetical protein